MIDTLQWLTRRLTADGIDAGEILWLAQGCPPTSRPNLDTNRARYITESIGVYADRPGCPKRTVVNTIYDLLDELATELEHEDTEHAAETTRDLAYVDHLRHQ